MLGFLPALCLLLALGADVSASERTNSALRAQIMKDPAKAETAVVKPRGEQASATAVSAWLNHASQRMRPWIADGDARMAFVDAVHRESKRARLDPELILALIQVESTFRQFAVSSRGALGYMQVMPFWVKAIGRDGHDLFDTNLNLRYGTVILRHYLDLESGDLFRALARYKGTRDRDDYAKMVIDTWRQWRRTDLPAPRDPVRVARVEARE
ncbi:MAG: transglycosylase SLT domain-containing protein [Burkholderiales bacterium]